MPNLIEQRVDLAWRAQDWLGYDWRSSRTFEPARDGAFVERMRRHLA